MTESHDVWVADGEKALQTLIGQQCPKRPTPTAALDCGYCIADALYEQHAVVERERDSLRRLAEALAGPMGGRCELTADDRDGRCEGQAKALRWEHGYVDEACDHHAETAEARGAIVVRPRKNDGTER